MYQVEELKELEQLKQKNEAPEWYEVPGYITISKGYKLKEETPRGMYKRVADSAANFLYQNVENIYNLTKKEMANVFFEAMWNNWLCPASPVLSNLGTDRGLPISCYGNNVGDSVQRIM